MFTREFLIESIIYILEKEKNLISINGLYSKIERIIKFPPDDEVLKFNFIISVNFLIRNNILFSNGKYIGIRKSNIKNFLEFDNINLQNNLNYKKNNESLKKIIIDIKNNNHLYRKFNINLLLGEVINII